MFERVILVPFIESESCPKGVEAQQLAESICDETLERASGAVGMMIGGLQNVEYLCQTRRWKIHEKLCPPSQLC